MCSSASPCGRIADFDSNCVAFYFFFPPKHEQMEMVGKLIKIVSMCAAE